MHKHSHGGTEVVTLVVGNGLVCHFAGANLLRVSLPDTSTPRSGVLQKRAFFSPLWLIGGQSPGSRAKHSHGGTEVVTLVVGNGLVCHFAGANLLRVSLPDVSTPGSGVLQKRAFFSFSG